MAEVTARFTIRDVRNKTKTHPVKFARGTLTLAEMTFAMNTYGGLLVPLLDGVITKCVLELPVALSSAITTVAGKPKALSNVSVGATISPRNSADVPEPVYIPTFDYGLRSREIPLNANADVTALVDAWVNGVLYDATNKIQFIDDNELDLVAVGRLFESTR